mmetsp:Transcript_5044/g.11504  ORF Transcript_5044/g.11504 Transcript_5044/m.11504 type:complete len:533 (+) Transcript_5044:296-1894(+)
MAAAVDRRHRLLLDDVVEARRPLARSEARRVRAVVHHECDTLRVHVGVQAVHSLDDRLVAHLAEPVSLLAQRDDRRHHQRDVRASGERVDRDAIISALRTLLALGTNTLTHFPHCRLVNLSHGETIEAVARVDDGADLVTARDILVNLVADVQARSERRRVRLHERFLVSLGGHRLVHRLHALRGDDLRDGARDGLNGVRERILRRHSLARVAAVQALDESVHAAEQNAALAVDVALVLALERGEEGKRRADAHRPSERNVRGGARRILVHGKRRVDARAVHLLALLVEAAHRRPHALGRDKHDVDVVAEVDAVVLHDSEKESVAQAERGSRLHRREQARVQRRLRGVRNKQEHEVARRRRLEDTRERSVRLGETRVNRLVVARGSLAQSDDHLGVHASLRERVAEVFRLRRSLRSPSDDRYLLDSVERLGNEVELVASTLDDELRLSLREVHLELGEHLGVELERGCALGWPDGRGCPAHSRLRAAVPVGARNRPPGRRRRRRRRACTAHSTPRSCVTSSTTQPDRNLTSC